MAKKKTVKKAVKATKLPEKKVQPAEPVDRPAIITALAITVFALSALTLAMTASVAAMPFKARNLAVPVYGMPLMVFFSANVAIAAMYIAAMAGAWKMKAWGVIVYIAAAVASFAFGAYATKMAMAIGSPGINLPGTIAGGVIAAMVQAWVIYTLFINILKRQ